MLTTRQISVGDNFYDSGVDFTTSGILRFQAAWVDMYSQGVFKYAPWYEPPSLHQQDFEAYVQPQVPMPWQP
jgi:hypothetical protein